MLGRSPDLYKVVSHDDDHDHDDHDDDDDDHDDDDDDNDDLYSNVMHRWMEQVCNEIDVFCASRLNAAAADTLQNVATEYSNIILLYVILIHI